MVGKSMNQRPSGLFKYLGWQVILQVSHRAKSVSPAEPSFDEKPNCVEDWAVKPKPFSFLEQILNSGYFLWRIEIQDSNYMKFLQFHLYKILLINKLFTKKYISWYLLCDDRMTIANLIEMGKCPIFNAKSSNIPD